jgi:hypothetical protein
LCEIDIEFSWKYSDESSTFFNIYSPQKNDRFMSAPDLWRRKTRKRTALFWAFFLDFFTLED